MALLTPSVPSGTGKGVNELFSLLNAVSARFDSLGLLVVTTGNIPPIKDMRVIWLASIKKVFNDNPEQGSNLYEFVNGAINSFHWSDLMALSMLADSAANNAVNFQYRTYKAGNRLFGESDLLTIYKNIAASTGTRDYNSEVAQVISEEALVTGEVSGGTVNDGEDTASSSSGGGSLVTVLLIGVLAFILFKR